jgi:hypothetical protein
MPKANMTPNYVPPLFMGVGAGAPIFETKTASFSVTEADSGKIFLVYGATAAVVVTLPAVGSIFSCQVVNLSDVDCTVQSVAADTLITYADLTADSAAFSTSSERIGGSFWCFGNGVIIAALARIASSYQNVTVVTA